MLVKMIVVTILISILFSLGSSLFYMMRDQGQTKRTVKALTLRISLSLGLFMLLMIGIATGVITPHAIIPPPPP